MAPSIGLNLRVTGYCNQGGRKYMEDVFSVAYQQTEDEKDLEYAFFGIFDGHGGREAAVFAKEHLMDFIVRQKSFWSEDDESILRAIREGFIQTHQAMWKELENWPKTASGLPSTAGTTASIAFIRRGKIYIGHVGDSAIVLGSQHPNIPHVWISNPLTRDHKPESLEESRRIHESGGKVVCKSGVPRVVWNRPKMGHKGMVRRSTLIDEIPFLAVARSLGDLWSYNSEEDVFIVSPEPDTYVYPIDITKHRCIVLGTDGLWNMLTPAQAVLQVCQVEKSNEQHMLYPTSGRQWINPSKRLVDRAIERWNQQNLRADNTSVVTVMLDPPGPPRAQVLKRQRELAMLNQGLTANQMNTDRGSVALVTNTTSDDQPEASPPTPPLPPVMSPPCYSQSSSSDTPVLPTEAQSSKNSGISIISRFPNSRNADDARGHNLAETARRNVSTLNNVVSANAESSSRLLHDFVATADNSRRRQLHEVPSASCSSLPTGHRTPLNRLSDSTSVLSRSLADSSSGHHHQHKNSAVGHQYGENHPQSQQQRDLRPTGDIQCNEISSSDDDTPVKDNSLKPSNQHPKQASKESRMSRELIALQLDHSPSKMSSPRITRRSVSACRINNQDSASLSDRLRSSSGKKSDSDVELRCKELNAKIKSIERKVAQKTRLLNQEVKMLQSTLMKSSSSTRSLRSQGSGMTTSQCIISPPRSLRPRSAASTPASTSRKRKLLTSSKGEACAAKSPRRSLSSVPVEKKPIMTRSRQARVLKLKKVK